MGTWGTKVFQNDGTLDRMYEIIRDPQIVHTVKHVAFKYISDLSSDEDDILLGVAFVDASVNGFDHDLFSKNSSVYGYAELLKALNAYPMYDLLDQAKLAIHHLIEEGVDNWSKDSAQDRMDLYMRYRDRINDAISKLKEKTNEAN